MSNNNDLIRMLATAIVSNPDYGFHPAAAEDVAIRLSESLASLNGRTVFKTKESGYLYDEAGANYGGVGEFVADLKKNAGYFFTDQPGGSVAPNPANLEGLSPVEKMKAARRAEAQKDENAGLHPDYAAYLARKAQAKPEAAPAPKQDRGLNFM